MHIRIRPGSSTAPAPVPTRRPPHTPHQESGKKGAARRAAGGGYRKGAQGPAARPAYFAAALTGILRSLRDEGTCEGHVTKGTCTECTTKGRAQVK
jgi:hypothetical protein